MDGEIASHSEEVEALKRSLQDLRRTTTLLRAEAQTNAEAREALQAQLIEANAEIERSWDRRKEMTRVIQERDSRLAEAQARLKDYDQMQLELAELRTEMKASRERRKELSQVIANRDKKIADLTHELNRRFEELAAMQRHIARNSLSGLAKRATRLFR